MSNCWCGCRYLIDIVVDDVVVAVAMVRADLDVGAAAVVYDTTRGTAVRVVAVVVAGASRIGLCSKS